MQLAQGNRTVRAVICNEVCSFFYSLFEEKGIRVRIIFYRTRRGGKQGRGMREERKSQTDRQTQREKYLQALEVV